MLRLCFSVMLYTQGILEHGKNGTSVPFFRGLMGLGEEVPFVALLQVKHFDDAGEAFGGFLNLGEAVGVGAEIEAAAAFFGDMVGAHASWQVFFFKAEDFNIELNASAFLGEEGKPAAPILVGDAV